MLVKQILFYLFLLPSVIFGQVSINFGRDYCDTIPDRFKRSVTELRSAIYDKIPGYSKTGKYEKVAYKFADYSAYSEKLLLESGDIYADWPELETYLNAILQEILPQNLKSNNNFHIYIHKSGDPNAFASPAGNIYINIGLISEVNTEAKLASVIAHELAHLTERHSFIHFIGDEFGAFGNGLLDRNWSEFRFSKNQELTADSLAFIWMKDSKYKVSELFEMFKSLQVQDVKNYKRNEKWGKKLIPHATSNERLAAFNRFIRKDRTDTGDFFVVDEAYFKKVHQESKYETLKILLKDLSSYDCLEQAFRFHLMEPDDPTFIYYIMESIRKLGYLLPEIWDENFLTYGHFDTVRVDNRIKRIPVTKSLFEEMDFDLLPLYQYEKDDLKAGFYWEEDAKFKTYNEAIEYYNTLGKALKCNECLLAYANSLESSDLKSKYLNGYIQSLAVSGNLDKSLIPINMGDSTYTNKIIFIDQFRVFVKQGQEYVYLSKDSSATLRNFADQIQASFPEKKVILLEDIKNRSLKEYEELMSVLYMSRKNIFNPVTKKVFNRYNANQFEYLRCEFYESKNLNNSLEIYKSIVETDYDTMFKKTGSTRKFNVWIHAVNFRNSSEFHYNTYEGVDNTIKFKEPGYDRMMPKILAAFKTKRY